jgi:hypothetical protein
MGCSHLTYSGERVHSGVLEYRRVGALSSLTVSRTGIPSKSDGHHRDGMRCLVSIRTTFANCTDCYRHISLSFLFAFTPAIVVKSRMRLPQSALQASCITRDYSWFARSCRVFLALLLLRQCPFALLTCCISENLHFD